MDRPRNTDSRDLTRVVLTVLAILVLIASSLWILLPFLLATIWATTIVVATWPLMLRVQGWLGKRRGAAVAVMVVVMLLAFVLPLALAFGSIVSNADTIAAWTASLPDMKLPDSPEWIGRIPLVGPRIVAAWDEVAGAGTRAIFIRLAPQSRDLVGWLLRRAGGLGAATVQFLMTVVIAAILYANGETAASGLRRFGRRLGGARGEDVVRLAGQSIRGVALGVVVTALAQTTLAGLGLAVAGVPFATMLTGVIFILCIAQLGPLLVLIPATIWVYSTGSSGWGTALLIWSLVVGFMDNALRPALIRRGADLPLLLIFSGVIGGLIGFGIIGLFVGPVLLAVTYTLLKDWIGAEQPPEAAGEKPTA
jgi:predicted PurR-regulated permease PerM